MIDRLLDLVRRRADAADALWRRVDETAIALEAGRVKSAGARQEAGVNVRVVCEGRVGFAGSTAAGDAALGALVDRAVASAAVGERLDLTFPGPAPMPEVPTYDERTATAPLDSLIALGRTLAERLARPGCQVNVGVERSVVETHVGNSQGGAGAYRSTVLAVGAEVLRVGGDDVLFVYDQRSGTDLPSKTELDALVRSIQTRLDLALEVVAPPEGSLPVVFTPAGLSAILLPLEHALSGQAVLQGVSPLADAVGRPRFDARLSITDDPLRSGRVGSRPCDDEGTPSRVVPLIEGGVVRRFIYDLETAARAKVESTGHGRRGVFGTPQLGFTNLVVTGAPEGGPPGSDAGALGGGLARGLEDALIVDDLIGVGQGNVIGGAFSHPVGLAYRVRRGEIVGRVKDAAVAGNSYTLLRAVAGFGADGRWIGRRWAPSLLLEGVSVARR